MSTAGTVLTTLRGVSGGITLAIEVAGQLVPLVKGLVLEIKKISAGADSMDYQILVQTDSDALNKVIQVSKDDLAAINAELTRMGLPPLSIPEEVEPE